LGQPVRQASALACEGRRERVSPQKRKKERSQTGVCSTNL